MLAALGVCHAQSPGGESSWKRSSQCDGVTIYSRDRAGSSTQEFKAIGTIDAAAPAVMAVLDDTASYPRFMPYVAECRLIKRDGDDLLSYQHLAPPLCSERDYTLRVHRSEIPGTAGVALRRDWKSANELGPAERPGIVRVKLNEGSWLLEPINDHETQATYCIYSDSGGALPAFIANRANRVGIGKVFEAVRRRVREGTARPSR